MARPPLALGTHGAVRLYKTPSGFRARTLFRDYDGRTRAVERTGRSKAAAETALKSALRDRARGGAGHDITADTRVKELAEVWFASLVDRAPTTLQAYRNRLDAQVLPGLGSLRVRELSVGMIDRHLRAVTQQHGPATAKMTRSVLSGMCALAARRDALDRNPVRDAGAIRSTAKPTPRAMTLAEVRQLRALLTYDDRAIGRDLPDLVAFMLATGLRIGEAAGVTWGTVDLDVGTVSVRSTVVRLKGEGLVNRPVTKSSAGQRTLLLPRWCIELLLVRRPENTGADTPVFPAPMGGLRDPSNSQSDLRQALDAAGFNWVTSHVFRKTTATMLDHAGLSARAIADQLGHSQPSLTQDVYMGRKVASTEAATALEAMATEE